MFGLLTLKSATVYAQSLTQDSTGVYYTAQQDKRCLECLINAPKKDTIIKDLKQVIKIDSTIIEKHENNLIILRNENREQQNKIANLLKNRKYLFIFGALTGLLTHFLR